VSRVPECPVGGEQIVCFLGVTVPCPNMLQDYLLPFRSEEDLKIADARDGGSGRPLQKNLLVVKDDRSSRGLRCRLYEVDSPPEQGTANQRDLEGKNEYSGTHAQVLVIRQRDSRESKDSVPSSRLQKILDVEVDPEG
jgi:hypothetical protein